MPFIPIYLVRGTEDGDTVDIPVHRISSAYVFPEEKRVRLNYFHLDRKRTFMVQGEPCAPLQDFLLQHFALVGHAWVNPTTVHSVRLKKADARIGFGRFAMETDGASLDQVQDLAEAARLLPAGNHLYTSLRYALVYRRAGDIYAPGRPVKVREPHRAEWESAVKSAGWMLVAPGTPNHGWVNPEQIRARYQDRLRLSGLVSVPMGLLSEQDLATVRAMHWVEAGPDQAFNLARVEMVGAPKASEQGCVFLGNDVSVRIDPAMIPQIIPRLDKLHGQGARHAG